MIGHVKRRARTSHDCNVCGGTIFYGEDYIRSVDLEREVRDRATGRRKVSARTARAHLRCSDAPECVATRRADAQRIVDAWNLAHPIGTPVTYWSWTRDVAGRESQTRTAAQLNGAHQPVVWVEGEPGCIALSHVDATMPDQAVVQESAR